MTRPHKLLGCLVFVRIWWYVLSRARAFQSFTTYKQQFYRTKTKLRKDIFNKAYTKQNHIKQNRPRLQN